MNKKQAYCCLNCSNLSPCNGAIDCDVCCEDCGDMSTCKGSAFLDKDDKFYLSYNYTANYSANEMGSGSDDIDCINVNELPSYNSSFAIELEILSGNNPLYNGSYDFSNSKTCCGISCCTNEDPISPSLTQESTIKTIIKDNFFTTVSISTPAHDYDGECGVETTTNSNGIYQGNLAIIDGSFCPCGYCEDIDTESEGAAGTIEKYRKKTKGFGSISFSTELKLYNSNGEEVEDPWSILNPPDPFDSCNPIRTATAPGCHFFAP